MRRAGLSKVSCTCGAQLSPPLLPPLCSPFPTSHFEMLTIYLLFLFFLISSHPPLRPLLTPCMSYNVWRFEWITANIPQPNQFDYIIWFINQPTQWARINVLSLSEWSDFSNAATVEMWKWICCAPLPLSPSRVQPVLFAFNYNSALHIFRL